jgi:hypothetical protein
VSPMGDVTDLGTGLAPALRSLEPLDPGFTSAAPVSPMGDVTDLGTGLAPALRSLEPLDPGFTSAAVACSRAGRKFSGWLD